MKFIRLFTGEGDQPHFEEVEPEFFTAEYERLIHPVDVKRKVM